VPAVEQHSPLFQAEALLRRARLLWQCGQPARAVADLERPRPLLDGSEDRLRVSQYALASWLVAQALDRPLEPGLLFRVSTVAWRSQHPLVHARLARMQGMLQAAEPALLLEARRLAERQGFVDLRWQLGDPAALAQLRAGAAAIFDAAGALRPWASAAPAADPAHLR